MDFREKFYPKGERVASLSYKDKQKLNNTITGDLVCFATFFLFTTTLILAGKTYIGVYMLIPAVSFLLSLILIKVNHLRTGSWLTTVGIFAGCVMIAFITKKTPNPVVVYRLGCFCAVMIILNYTMALQQSQITIFFMAVMVLIPASTFILYSDAMEENLRPWLTDIAVNIVAEITAGLAVFSTNRLTEKIIHHSENEHNKAEESLQKFTHVLSQTREGLNVGKKLNESADAASASVNEINRIYNALMKETEELEEQVTSIKSSGEIVNQNTIRMNGTIREQNNSLEEMSSAITQIATNISNVNTIAENRRQGMQNVTEILDKLASLIQKLVTQVEQVQESSNGIQSFVKTVDSIAGQTNLLAMNASIESAHAGEAGKGFGVIAQEIRKLSEETTKNATQITKTLNENTEVVQETTSYVGDIAQSTKKSTEEIRATINSMEEIIHGIREMDIGTKDVMHSVNTIVSQSSENSKIIEEVVNQIEAQTESLDIVTKSASQLREHVAQISSMIQAISDAMEDVHTSARENEDVSAKLVALLN